MNVRQYGRQNHRSASVENQCRAPADLFELRKRRLTGLWATGAKEVWAPKLIVVLLRKRRKARSFAFASLAVRLARSTYRANNGDSSFALEKRAGSRFGAAKIA